MKKSEFSAACEIEMEKVKDRNGLVKMTSENESKDGAVKHSKEQKPESI